MVFGKGFLKKVTVVVSGRERKESVGDAEGNETAYDGYRSRVVLL